MKKFQDRTIQLESRKCECCGSNDFENLWKNEQTVKTKNYFWNFQMNNVICKNCGFIFISPAPTTNELMDYYSDSYAYYSLDSISYSIENRIAFIEQNMTGNNVFIEIGSNQETKFHEQLSKYFSEIITIEINSDVNSHYNSVNNIDNIKADMIALYYVLEHVPNINDFLLKCNKLLDENWRKR